MKRSSFKISQTIDVTPEEAWEVIGAVSGVDEWLGPITSCVVEDNKRICGTEEGTFEEEILNVDHDNKTLDYLIPQQHMMPVENIKGQMKVVNTGGQANITWKWEYDVMEENEETAKGALQMVGGMGIAGIETLIKQRVA